MVKKILPGKDKNKEKKISNKKKAVAPAKPKKMIMPKQELVPTEVKEFDDPLRHIDPIMEDIFTIEDENDDEEYEVSHNINKIQFPQLEPVEETKKLEEDVFSNIPVSITVELGRSEISLKEVYELSEGSIIELSRYVGEPLDLVVNGQIIATGEVVSVDNNYGLRITEVISKAVK